MKTILIIMGAESGEFAGASKKMLVQRLKEMENNKLVKRRVVSTKPIAVTYEITALGLKALEFLEGLKDWVVDNDL